LITLLLPKSGIITLQFEQFCMAAHLNNLAVVENNNLISLLDRAQTVGDHEGALIGAPLEGLLHQMFALAIQSAGGLIEYQ
jgi:hypothetical protein